MKKTLDDWLSYIESLHPKSIAMGLDRVNAMIMRMGLHPTFPIITVAGTNGKGSTSAILENIYHLAGYQVGCYTSPHLLKFNERLRINLQQVDDEALCQAFAMVEAARTNGPRIELTYFEFGTLAAVWHLMQTSIDVAILEIGLGGRLDAVNAFTPDCAIVTNVDLDHQDYLGDTREKIGFEKAGVYRPSTPAICGDESPPASLIAFAQQINADFLAIGEHFKITPQKDDWQYALKDKPGQSIVETMPYPALSGQYQLNNAACAITAVYQMQAKLPVDLASIHQALQQVFVAGRFEKVLVPLQRDNQKALATVILDVAHNPHAARALKENLTQLSIKKPAKWIAVFAMLNDKDIAAVVETLKDVIDVWYVADISQQRGEKAENIANIIRHKVHNATVKCFADAATACEHALKENEFYKAENENDKIVAFGSFYTIACVKQWLLKQQ
jgi:dihydrofolate synthase/folylpolyglutamate synthase